MFGIEWLINECLQQVLKFIDWTVTRYMYMLLVIHWLQINLFYCIAYIKTWVYNLMADTDFF